MRVASRITEERRKTSQNVTLGLNLRGNLKIFLMLAKDSWKTDIKLFTGGVL